ncbi:MAG TPA: hypothetical protein VJJ83_02330, partial [Candidatus Babeliales bacterium]|nr:hypothetical protein [Candidatus Babeliales bacterium]
MLNQRFVLIILLSSSYWLVSAAEIPDSWEDAADIAELGGVANGAPAAQPLMAAAEPVGDEDLGLPRRQLRHPSLAWQSSATNAAPDTMMTTGGGGGGSSEGLASPPLTSRSAVSFAYSDGGFFSSRRGQPASTVHTGAEQPSPTLSLGSARGRPLPNFSDSPQFETLAPIAEEAGMEQLARTLSADFAAAVPMELASPRTTKSPKTPVKSPP